MRTMKSNKLNRTSEVHFSCIIRAYPAQDMVLRKQPGWTREARWMAVIRMSQTVGNPVVERASIAGSAQPRNGSPRADTIQIVLNLQLRPLKVTTALKK